MPPAHPAPPRTDLELLTIEAEMVMDGRRRLAGVRGIKLSVARDGQLLFVGSEVPDALVPALTDTVERSPRPPAPDQEPPALAACRAILEPSCGPVFVRAGPYYAIEPRVRPEGWPGIVRSDVGPVEPLRSLNPGTWEPDEWDALLDGTLGPWAVAVADGIAVSVCHTPRVSTAQAAECGVWTRPDYRGRGYAAEVTATWAHILRPSGQVLFYSTDADNRSSRRVAARLGLREIGWTWNLARVDADRLDPRHPLSPRRS